MGFEYMVGMPGVWPGLLALEKKDGWENGGWGGAAEEKYSFTGEDKSMYQKDHISNIPHILYEFKD